MRKKVLITVVLLTGALASTLTLTAQQPHATSKKFRITGTNVAVLFNFERAQVAQSGTPSFWLKGGAADASVTFWKGLGLAANLTGEHASNIANNVSLGKTAFMAGPRYTFNTSKYTDSMTKKHRTELFGEWLFGGAHAFDSTFPGTNGFQTSAGAFSMQAGGGMDISIAKGFGVRALEMDWVHTSLPNNAGNSQNDLRIAFGVSYRR
jgi:hypothetical protein